MRKVRILALALLIVCLALAFAACELGIRFHLNFVVDGDVYATINTAGNESITLPQNPEKDGDEFDGWYWDKDVWEKPFTANSLLNTPLSSDTNVYAKWKSNGEAERDPSAAKIESAPSFQMDGTTLSLTVSNATDSFSFLDQISVSSKANWQVSTDMQGVNSIPSKTVPLNEGDNSFYILVTSSNGEGISLYTVTIRRRPIYTVSFETNGGSTVVAQEIEEDAFATQPTTARTGYTFSAWDYDFALPVKGDTTVTASWTAINYPIVYTLNGGTNNELNPTTYTVEDSVNLSTPTRSGYSFVGWTNDGTIIAGSTGEKSFTANWMPTNYPITYTLCGGTNNGNNPATYTIEDDEITLASPSRIGYTFAGWSSGGTIPAGSLGEKVFVANWTPINYPITYTMNGGTNNELNPTSYTVEDEINLSAPTRFGYTFTDWSNGGTIPAGSTDEMIFVASWMAINYPITYIMNGGTNNELNPATYTIEDDEITLASPSRIGYTFAGWSNGGTISADSTGEKSFIANWTPIVYTINYDLNGGVFEGGNPTDYTIEDDITLFEPTRDCYHFLGWYDADGTKVTNLLGYYGNLTLTAGWECYYTVNASGAITGVSYYCKQYVTSLIIPTILNDVEIKSISANAFSNCQKLTSVVIPDSVTSIGSGAFSGCSKLESITIPFVGAEAGKTELDTYQYPFGYIFGTTNYTGGTATNQYYYGSSTDSTTNTVYYIPGSLRSVIVSGGNILYGAFRSCSSLTSVSIPDNVTSIGDFAFYNCTGLTSVIIPDGVTVIGQNVFRSCSGLISITIPDNVSSIGDYAFYNCSGLISITIPNGIASIESYTFSGCSSLTTITIPDSVTSIGEKAFYNCSALINVTIPCSAITSIPKSQLQTVVITSGDTIPKNAFRDCSCLSAVTIYGVTSIGDRAFYNCPSLASIIISDSVTTIGEYAFSDCNCLTTIIIPDSVTGIGNTAFRNCTSLFKVVWNATNCTSAGCLGYPIFQNCSSLTTVTFGENVQIIPPYAFYSCHSLTSVIIPDSVTTIGESAFEFCSSLVSFSIGKNVTNIGDRAFSSCTGLTSIIIPANVTSIGTYVFSACSGLTSVTFANTTGWYITQTQGAGSGTNMTVTDTSTNAYNLYRVYYNYYWCRN